MAHSWCERQSAEGLLSISYLAAQALRPNVAIFTNATASPLGAMNLVKQNPAIPMSHPTNGLADCSVSDFEEADRLDFSSNVLEEEGTVAALAKPGRDRDNAAI